MGYQALYRRYRPARFEDFVGQEAVIKTLRSQITSGRIAHAYLFCGTRGTGKTSTAKVFARAVNCEHPENGDPCGTCDTCRALAEENSLDILEIDAASNNGVDEIRDLREKVKYPAADGALSRVYHRRGAHALAGRVQRAAQDAGRAARLRRVHFGDDGAAEAPGDDPFPLSAVRFRADSRAPDHRAAARCAGGRPYSGRGRGAFPHRPRGGGRHARRMVDHGHVPFLRAGGERRADGGARASGARRGG